MLNLKDEQIEFIENELGISEKELENINKDDWRKIREKCFNLSVDELLDEDGYAIDDVTEKCIMAESIADMKYSELIE